MVAVGYGSDSIRANSYHHQAVDRVGNGLRVVGRTADGLVEALEGDGNAFLLGVQWHPEMSWKAFPEHHTVFRLLVNAAEAHLMASLGDIEGTRLPSATASGAD